MCWYVVVLDGEIAHLGIEPHATKALAENSVAEMVAKRSGEGLGFPHALLEVPEPLAATDDARWYVLELAERVARVAPDWPFDAEVWAREAAVRGYALWALLRVCGFLQASPSNPRQRSRNRGSRARAHRPRVGLHDRAESGARTRQEA